MVVRGTEAKAYVEFYTSYDAAGAFHGPHDGCDESSLPSTMTAITREAMQAEIAAKAEPKQEETEDLQTVWGYAGFLRVYGDHVSSYACNRLLVCWVFADGTTHDHYRLGDEWAVAVRVRKE
jgi:hypothetical protein